MATTAAIERAAKRGIGGDDAIDSLLLQYELATGGQPFDPLKTRPHDVLVVQVLTDLIVWCDRHSNEARQLCFDKLVARAWEMFSAHIDPEPEPCTEARPCSDL